MAADSAAITTAPGTTLTATRRTTAPSMPRLGAPRSTTAVFRLAERPRAQVDAANVLQHVVLKVDGLDHAEVERLLTVVAPAMT